MRQDSVIIKSNKHGLILILDDQIPFEELLLQVELKFKEAAKFFRNVKMSITFHGCVLSRDQEKQIIQTIVENSPIHILCIIDGEKEDALYHRKILDFE